MSSVNPQTPFRPKRLILLPSLREPEETLAILHRQLQVQHHRSLPQLGNMQIIEVHPDTDMTDLANRYLASGQVRWIEPEYLVRAVTEPDDPSYRDGTQWNLHNIGQSNGTADADIDAPEGWEIHNDASTVVVAVVDTGIRHTHEDLRDNMWLNPGEIPGNDIDDDNNGWVDDLHGINAAEGTGDSRDVAGHGTHAAGIVGAVGNNGKGVSGVAWTVQLMACRFLASDGSGSTADAVVSIDYALQMGAHIINASWVGTDYSLAIEESIARARDQGVLFIAAAGNSGRDNDVEPHYPASLPLDNIISVAATTRRDERLDFSNYGRHSVDLAAPGLSITSTYFIVDSSYVAFAGTSAAAPHVAGVAALVWSRFPEADYAAVRDRILRSVDPLPDLQDKCVTGGRLNLNNALRAPQLVISQLAPANPQIVIGLRGGPDTTYILEQASTLDAWSPVRTNTLPTAGYLPAILATEPSQPLRLYRVRQHD